MLDARQKTTNAANARSNDDRLSSCCANTIPTKRARFFVHCLGRIASDRARRRPPIPNVEDLVVAPLVVEERSSFCSRVWFARVIVIFPKSYRILQRQKARTAYPIETYSNHSE